MSQAKFGVVGLGTMGGNLSLNLASRGYRVSVYNRTQSVTARLVARRGKLPLKGYRSLQALVSSISKPRSLILMVTAGSPVDEVVGALLPHVSKGDILVDGGNSNFKDTERRAQAVAKEGVEFAGVGFSGGEEGALKGPSVMVGCSVPAWRELGPAFESISAKAFDGTPCCARLGGGGAGHYVKMVHNAIEYVEMEMIAEAYHVMKNSGANDGRIASIFDGWNRGALRSYLTEITAKILRVVDRESGKPLVELILDEAEQKGTGRWAAESAMELGVPSWSLGVAAQDRSMSALKAERVKAGSTLRGVRARGGRPRVKASELGSALLSANICAFAQGFALLSAASKVYGWGIPLPEVARIWQGGCIIRADLLKDVRSSLLDGPDRNLLLAPSLSRKLARGDRGLRKVVSDAVLARIPVPGLAGCLAYTDSYFSERLPANLIQAQRDYFGAHTYRRMDKEGRFHTDWGEA